MESPQSLNKSDAIIRQKGGKWVLYSHEGKQLATFDSEEEAKKREKQINYFKHVKAEDLVPSLAGDTYHNRFSPSRKHNKGSKKYKPLPRKCSKCGSTRNLDIDHKDGNRKNNKRSNLRVLCRSCHRKMHDGGSHATEILVKGAIFEPDDSDKALAGDHHNSDLMHVKFELCHTGANKNRDGFITEEMESGYSTAINKPLNWEHTTENIGTIYASEFSKDESGNGTIIVKAAVWKHKHPERARAIAQRYADGKLFFSMETYFQKAKCSICEGEYGSSLEYCDHLNARGNSETVRWLKGLNFVGAGVVKNPADVKSVGLAVASKRVDFKKLTKIVEALGVEVSTSEWVRFIKNKGEFDEKS